MQPLSISAPVRAGFRSPWQATVFERSQSIVVSRLADEQLWAEALNLGDWDVLATPFDRSESIRSVASGWRHWKGLHSPKKALKLAAAS
jgi:hypothetical protein